ncbi:hypothetical protein KAW48_04155, partial [candidate division WOR-3 bacterium]|nr:hypothetical protein [candidate division WOR-3 bacterium]
MRRIVILSVLLLFSVSLMGRVKVMDSKGMQKQDVYEYKAHTVGGIWTVESNFGAYGDPNFSTTGNPSYDYPAGFGYAYLWEGRLWLGAEIPLYVRSALGTSLDSVRVVPNPYYGSASWEAQYENRITFMYLPQNCRIKIFSLSGDLIREINHIG